MKSSYQKKKKNFHFNFLIFQFTREWIKLPKRFWHHSTCFQIMHIVSKFQFFIHISIAVKLKSDLDYNSVDRLSCCMQYWLIKVVHVFASFNQLGGRSVGSVGFGLLLTFVKQGCAYLTGQAVIYKASFFWHFHAHSKRHIHLIQDNIIDLIQLFLRPAIDCLDHWK